MKLFFAGSLNRSREITTTIAQGIARRLFSYYAAKETLASMGAWEESMKECEFFLDSGAFSAWTRGETIDLQQYAQFVLDRPGIFDVVVNLDVIPGAWGHVPTQREIDESAARGWENYYALEKLLAPAEIKPLHIYHQGEDIKWLKKLMDEAEYFGVSPANDQTAKQRAVWLDQIMPILTDDRGYPIRKFHGFGVTSLRLLEQFPWASADSTSWLMTANFGGIFVPWVDSNGHEDVYKEYKVVFSKKSSALKDKVGTGNHFDNLTPPERKRVLAYLESIGTTPQALAEDYLARDTANIKFFMRLERLIPPYEEKRWQRHSAMETLL